MAKLTNKEETLLIADYKTNKFSQRGLAEKYNCSVGVVSKLTKMVLPDNEHVHNAQVVVLIASSILPPEQMNAIMNTAKDEVYNRHLATNASQLNLIRMTNHLENNTKLEKIGIGGGVQELAEIGLDSADYKNIQDGIDKASITLGVNPRFSTTPLVTNTNTNAQQNNSNLTEQEINDQLAQFEQRG